MKNVIEINKPTVDALRMSPYLPNAVESGSGHLHILYGDQFKPVGYLVHKEPENPGFITGGESGEDRYFTTLRLWDAVALLNVPYAKLPQPDGTQKKAPEVNTYVVKPSRDKFAGGLLD